MIAATPPRASAARRDLRRGRRSTRCRAGARVGTSSLRRTAQIGRCARTSRSSELRGNVDTRLAKLEGGEYARSCWRSPACSGSGARTTRRASSTSSFRRPGRASLALAARADDAQALGAVAALDDADDPRLPAAPSARSSARSRPTATRPSAPTPRSTAARDADAERLRRPPDGVGWVRDTLTTDGDPERPARGARSARRRAELRSAGADEVLGR